MKGRLLLALAISVCLLHSLTEAATNLTPAESLSGKLELIDPSLNKLFIKALSDPVVQTRFLDALTNRVWQSGNSNAILGLINDLHLKFKFFKAQHSDNDAVPGFEYSYDKSLAGRTINPESRDPIGLSLNFSAKGNVAFEQSKNPNNFLETSGKFHIFQAIGGLEPLIFNEDAARAMNQAAVEATRIRTTGPEREKDPRWQAISKTITAQIRPQFLYDVAGNFALESDQSFANKQLTYGGQVGMVLRDWRDESVWSWLNIFDYPFAGIRFITGVDKLFQPSGQAIPAILGGVDLVDPYDNKERAAIDPNKDKYPRLRAEVAFKTQVGRFLAKDVWFSASYRYFKELGASSAIRDANLDEFRYFAASLEFLGSFSLNFSNGKLPFDHKSEQVYALGYTFKF